MREGKKKEIQTVLGDQLFREPTPGHSNIRKKTTKGQKSIVLAWTLQKPS